MREYSRTVVLLPQHADTPWWVACTIVCSSRRWTLTSSADDACIGEGLPRTVYVIDPEAWGGTSALENFASQYYGGGIRWLSVPVDETPWRTACHLLATTEKLSITLSQKDPRWANELLGEGDETVGKAGCILIALTSAMRMHGFDVTPPIVNRLLLNAQRVFSGSILANWQALWLAIPVEKAVIYSNARPTLAYLRTLVNNGYEVIVPNNTHSHYYLVLEVRSRSFVVLDPADGNCRILTTGDIAGIRAFRFLRPRNFIQPPMPAAPPASNNQPPSTMAWQIPDRLIVTAHLQSPTLSQPLAAYLPRARSVKTLCPEAIMPLRRLTTVVYRPYVNDYDQEQIVRAAMENPVFGARLFMDALLNRLSAAGMTLSDLAGCYVETLNETFGSPSPDDRIAAVVSMDTKIAELLEPFGARVVMLNVPVENITDSQARLLLPAAKLSSERGHALGYHAYWPVYDGQAVRDRWRESALRALEVWDPLFLRHGLRPRYFFGECGAVGWNGVYDPEAGWRVCYHQDWQRYRDDLTTFVTAVKAWEARYGRRVLGAALFTTNDFGSWPNFLLGDAQWADLNTSPVG